MNNLELHYYLGHGSHSMDAFIKNRSEYELLKLFNEIALFLDIEIELEIEAISQGGIKEVIKFFEKKKNKKYLYILMVFSTIVSGVLINVISDIANKDTELENLTKEEKRLNIRKLKQDLAKGSIEDNSQAVEQITKLINNEYKIRVFKSRFYSQIIKEEKIYQFSITQLSDDLVPISKEMKISRESFSRQILDSEHPQITIVENANVEIVSPVLKPGNIRWRAIYNGKPISFNLLDASFKNSVLNKQYSFSNGTSIRCKLELKEAINDSGELYYKETNVYDVLEVFDGITTIVTNKSKQLKEIANQTRMEFNP